MYKVFSGLLQPRTECGDISGRLLACIEVDLILGFLDLVLTGDSKQELDLLASLKACMTLATIHKFCCPHLPKGAPASPEKRVTWEEKYRYFHEMALHGWKKACECLREAYNQNPDTKLWWRRLEKVATAFAVHIHQPHKVGELPQGELDPSILRENLLADADGLHRAFWQVVLQAWFGTKARGMFSGSEGKSDGIPIQLLPSNFETAIGSKLLDLPKELSAVSVIPTSRIQEVDD